MERERETGRECKREREMIEEKVRMSNLKGRILK